MSTPEGGPPHEPTPAWDPTAPPAPPELRASDQDRERVITMLRDHYTAGRITLDELAERAEVALQARTHADLDDLTSDLVARPVPPPAPEPAEPVKQTPWALAILSTQRKRGRWRVGEETGALAICGTCQLDLRQAQLPASGTVQINAVGVMGSVDIIVPEGVEVDLDGMAFLGSNEVKTRAETIPGLPRVRVQAFSLMGSIVVRNPSRREQRAMNKRVEREGLPHGREAALDMREQMRDRREEMRDQRDEMREQRDEMRRTAREDRNAAREERHAARGERHAARGNREYRDDMQALGRDIAQEMKEQAGRLRDDLIERHRSGNLDFDGVRSAISDVIERMAVSVQQERPDFGPHVAPDGTVTILFSDIEGFTELTERLGDLRAQDIIRDHNRIVATHVAAHMGYKVKDAGDGVMVVFESARRALRCARDIQRAFGDYSRKNPETPLNVRIGLHTGEVIRERGPDDRDDFYGKNVILAARIAQQAGGGDVLVSSLVCELVGSSGEFMFGDAREVALKGLSGTYRIHAMDWTRDPPGLPR